MRTPTGNRWMSDNYLTWCHRWLREFELQFELVRVPFAVRVSWGQDASMRISLRPLSDPQLSSPARMQKKCCYGQKNFGSICSSLSPSPTLLSPTTNINLFELSVRVIIFIKKCVRSFIEPHHIVDYVSAYILYMYYVYVCGYITKVVGWGRASHLCFSHLLRNAVPYFVDLLIFTG